MAAAWAIPVGVLSALCVLMFIFIWWWFPRHYRKGVEMDMAEVDEARRERELYAAQQAQQAQQGTQTTDGAAAPVPQPPRQFTYTPQAYTSY